MIADIVLQGFLGLVGSGTFQKVVLLHFTTKNSETEILRLRDFSFHLSSTFIYELILIQIYMNANIMNSQIIQIIMTSKVTEGHTVHPILGLTQTFPFWKVC